MRDTPTEARMDTEKDHATAAPFVIPALKEAAKRRAKMINVLANWRFYTIMLLMSIGFHLAARRIERLEECVRLQSIKIAELQERLDLVVLRLGEIVRGD